MKNIFTKLVALVLVFITQINSTLAFQDVGLDKSEILYLHESNVIEGRRAGFFEPSADVNRAEMLKIILEATDISPNIYEYNNCFPDVKTEWFAPYICYAKSKQIIGGYPDGYFHPGNKVNLVEALKIVLNTYEITGTEINTELCYTPFLEAGLNLNVITDNISADKNLTRREMANLVTRSAVAYISGDKFQPRTLEAIREWGLNIQDFVKKDKQREIRDRVRKIADNEWLVKVSSNDGKVFEVKYSYHDYPFIVHAGVDKVYQMPTIHIEEGGAKAHLGLSPDFVWDGLISLSDQKLIADADLFGFFDESINLSFDPANKVVHIYSALKNKEATFNLRTGSITGDTELSQGFSNLRESFGKGEEVYRVCVSDAKGYYGEIGIFNDFKTVGLRECPQHPRTRPDAIEAENLVAPYVPGGPLPKSKKFPPTGGQRVESAQGGEVAELKEPEGIVNNPHVLAPVTKNGNGQQGGAKPPAPYPEDHPGFGYEWPHENPDNWQDFANRVETAYTKSEERAEENDAELAEGQQDLEDLMEDLDIKKPSKPNFNASKCCPTYQKDGKCCSDLDLSTAEGRAEYKKRIQCLVDEFNETREELRELLNSVNFLTGKLYDMAQIEDELEALQDILDIGKGGLHIAIDVATGGQDWMGTLLQSTINEVLGGEAGQLYKSSTGDAEGSISDAGKAAGNQIINKITNFDEKVGEIAGKFADSIGLTGNTKERFIENMKSNIGDNPLDIFSSATWLKVGTDFLLDMIGGEADDLMDAIKQVRKKRNNDIKEAWGKTVLMRQINDVLNKVRTEECGKKYVKAIKKKVEDIKKEREKYRERRIADQKSVGDLLEWLMNNEFSTLSAGDPDQAELKARLMQKLKKKLCLVGYDLCWVDISFDIMWQKDQNGNWSWKIVNLRVKKRSEAKDDEDCKCEDIFGDEDESEDTVAETDETAQTIIITEDESSSTSYCGSCEPIETSGSAESTPPIIPEDPAEEYPDPIVTEDSCFEVDPIQYDGKVQFNVVDGLIYSTECPMLEIPMDQVHENMLQRFPENPEEVWILFSDPEGIYPVYDMSTGELYKDGELLHLEFR